MIASTLALALIAGSPNYLVTAVARTQPAGGYLGGAATYQLSDESNWAGGMYLNYYYYWFEAGLKLDWEYLGRFLYFENSVGVEPGKFIHAGETDNRDFGWRGVARSRLTVNYRPSWYWLYSRSTVEGRLRNFTENDIYRGAILSSELSFEQAIATLFRVYSYGENASIRAYAEMTTLAEASAGLLDLRPSGGIMYENILDGVTLNTDVYYGLQEGTLGGLGVLFLVWWQL